MTCKQLTRILFPVALTLILIVACSDEEGDNGVSPTVTTGTISARITETEGGLPLMAVSVWTDQSDDTVYTDYDGRFILEELDPGDVTIYAARVGYGRVSQLETVARNDTTVAYMYMTMDDTHIPMDFDHWRVYSNGAGDYVQPDSGVFEELGLGLRFYGTDSEERDGYSLMHSTDLYEVLDKTVFVEWNAHSHGQYAQFKLALTYEEEFWFSDPGWRFSDVDFTAIHSHNGSVVIDTDVWLYTRVRIEEGTYTAVTANDRYDINGGEVISTFTQGEIDDNYLRKPIFRLSENYQGSNVYMMIRQVCLVEN